MFSLKRGEKLRVFSRLVEKVWSFLKGRKIHVTMLLKKETNEEYLRRITVKGSQEANQEYVDEFLNMHLKPHRTPDDGGQSSL